MHFRPIQKDDLQAVLTLIKGLATHERRPEAVTATVEDLDRILFADHPLGYGIIAEIDGVTVGYALLVIKFSSFRGKPILYIEDVFISDQARGKGNGRAFMKAIAQFALDHNCVAMEWSALDFNDLAINFYEKLGAELETGRVHFDADHALMKKWSEN